MVTVWFGVGQFLSGAMGQLYPGGDTDDINRINEQSKKLYQYINDNI